MVSVLWGVPRDGGVPHVQKYVPLVHLEEAVPLNATVQTTRRVIM